MHAASHTLTEIRRRAAAVERLRALMPGDRPLAESALAYLLSYAEVSAVMLHAESLKPARMPAWIKEKLEKQGF